MTWPEAGFEPAGPYSSRVSCTTCGASGYPGGRWMERHRGPHVPCPWCGRREALTKTGKVQTHTRCPKRPSTADTHRSKVGA